MQGGYAGVFSMLIEAGANPAQLTSDGSTLLALAVEVSTLPVIVMFVAKGSPTTLYSNFMQRGHTEVVKVLLNKDASDTDTDSCDVISIYSESDPSSLMDMY